MDLAGFEPDLRDGLPEVPFAGHARTARLATPDFDARLSAFAHVVHHELPGP